MSTFEGSTGAGAPGSGSVLSPGTALQKVRNALGGGSVPPPPPRPPGDGDEEEDGMLRMSFLQHLEELRTRIFRALSGVGIAFILSLTFSNQLWIFVQKPAQQALTTLQPVPPNLHHFTPIAHFN